MLKKLCHGDIEVFGSNALPQIKTKNLCRTRNVYRTLRGIHKVDSRRGSRLYNQSYSECLKIEAKNMKTLAQFFQDVVQFHPGHLQLKTLMFTLRALVE